MSRQIDTSKTLSKEDKLYLAQRGQLDPMKYPVSEQRELLESSDVPLSERANTGDANTVNISKEEYESLLSLRRAEQEATDVSKLQDLSGEAAATAVDEEDDDEVDDYNDLTIPQLRAAIAGRNEDRADEDKISLDGNKGDLVAALEADDEEE